jgi:4-hydroxy 2-oxovalerate aldolase
MKNLKILDCTIRDGGLVNNHQFSLEFVKKLAGYLSLANIDYMEVGYKNSKKLFSEKEYGLWKFCDDDNIWPVKNQLFGHTKLAVMVDVGREDLSTIKKASESPYSLIRVACYVKDIKRGIELVNYFNELGYETSINIMAISRDNGIELTNALDLINDTCKANYVYILDSFGAFYPNDIKNQIFRYRSIINNKKFGFHGHNNQQLAFANTIISIEERIDILDSTVYGIGRGAGNCPTELLISYLIKHLPDEIPERVRILSIIKAIQELVLPLQKDFDWRYNIPLMITGTLNKHPKAAINFNKEQQQDLIDFYSKLKL